VNCGGWASEIGSTLLQIVAIVVVGLLTMGYRILVEMPNIGNMIADRIFESYKDLVNKEKTDL